MIISILDTAFKSAKSSDFNYQSAPMWELNYTDSTDKPVVFFALPLSATNSFIKTGQKITRIVANIFFLKKSLLSDLQPTRTPIVDEMHDAMNEFYKNFEADASLYPEIKSIRYDDVYNFFDMNLDGISSVVDFEFNGELC